MRYAQGRLVKNGSSRGQRKGNRGAQSKPRQVAPDDLLYAQVVKHRENGRVVEVNYRIVFGQEEAIEQRLKQSPVSHTINTSFVERGNLTLHQSNCRLTRKTNGFSKEISGLEKQLWVSLAYYHFVLPHQSLRISFKTPIPTRGSGSEKRWQAVTPALAKPCPIGLLAAGSTDHIWSTSELLSYRVPADFLNEIAELKSLFPDWDQEEEKYD